MRTNNLNSHTTDWSLQAPHLSNNEIKIKTVTENILGHKFPAISQKLTSLFSLYQFFVRNINVDPKVLQQHITDNGKPIFTLDDIKQIQAVIKRQLKNPLSQENARRVVSQIKRDYASVMKGGANIPTAKTVGIGKPEPPIFTLRDPTKPGYNPMDDPLGGPSRPEHVDAARNGFWDRIFLKMGSIYDKSPFALKFSHKWDGVWWFMYILYNLENADLVGPILSVGLDSYVVGCRMVADLINESVPGLLSAFGSFIPGGGIVAGMFGEAIATVFSGCILLSSVIVSISRKHFGDAFKASLEMIPFIGDSLLLFAMSAETNLDRMNAYRHKIVNQIEPVSPLLYNYLDYTVPKLEPLPPGPAPSAPSFDEIKDDIIESNETLSKAMNAIENPMGALTNQLPPGMKDLATNPLGAVTSQIPSGITNIAKNPVNAIASQLPNVPKMPVLPEMPNVPKMPVMPEMPKVPKPNLANMTKTAFQPTMIRKRGGGRTRTRTRTRKSKNKRRNISRRKSTQRR